jgi:hypothetical protein
MFKRLINKIIKKQSKRIRTSTADSSIKNGEEVKEQTEIEQIKTRLAKLEGDLEKAISGYRLMLISQNPDILPELVQGESIEALERSLATARELTARMKQKLEQQMAAERIPAGAPARSTADPENLSSYEKIRYGLEKK